MKLDCLSLTMMRIGKLGETCFGPALQSVTEDST